MTSKQTKRKALTYKSDDPADDEDFLPCLRYVQAVEMEGKTKAQFCIEEGINPATIWQWQIKWTENGMLRKIRQYFSAIITDDARVAQSIAAQQYGDVLQVQIQLALHAKSEFVRHQAGAWVHDRILLPMMGAQEDPGSDERDYITLITRSKRSLEPLSIGQADDPEPEALTASTDQSSDAASDPSTSPDA